MKITALPFEKDFYRIFKNLFIFNLKKKKKNFVKYFFATLNVEIE